MGRRRLRRRRDRRGGGLGLRIASSFQLPASSSPCFPFCSFRLQAEVSTLCYRMLVELFGLLAVTAMVTMYALQARGRAYVLGLALACAAASVDATLIHSWPCRRRPKHRFRSPATRRGSRYRPHREDVEERIRPQGAADVFHRTPTTGSKARHAARWRIEFVETWKARGHSGADHRFGR